MVLFGVQLDDSVKVYGVFLGLLAVDFLLNLDALLVVLEGLGVVAFVLVHRTDTENRLGDLFCAFAFQFQLDLEAPFIIL